MGHEYPERMLKHIGVVLSQICSLFSQRHRHVLEGRRELIKRLDVSVLLVGQLPSREFGDFQIPERRSSKVSSSFIRIRVVYLLTSGFLSFPFCSLESRQLAGHP
jgi:hypothetical protein